MLGILIQTREEGKSRSILLNKDTMPSRRSATDLYCVIEGRVSYVQQQQRSRLLSKSSKGLSVCAQNQ